MKDLPAYCEAVGYPVPLSANPTDFVMDLVTPGSRRSADDLFADQYERHCSPSIDLRVEKELTIERQSALEVLECRRKRLTRYGRMPPVRSSKFGVGFRKQVLIVGWRQVTLYLRDSRGVAADLLVSVGKGVILGLTYLNIGEQGAFEQLPFFFMLMMATAVESMKGMPKLISERRVMKVETSEFLYSEWAFIVPFTIISWIQAITANTMFVVVLFSVCTMPWGLFGSLWLWTTLLYLAMDSMFLMLSAIAKDAATASVMALPFFMLFLLFNGFTVSRNSAAWYEGWLLNISPVAFAIEQATMSAGRFYGTTDYLTLAGIFGYRYEPVRAVFVMLSVTTVFRIMQVMCLKFLNNIHR